MKIKCLTSRKLGLLLTLAGAGLLLAADSSSEDKPRTVILNLRPVDEPDLALSIRLIPGPLARKPGNAAQYYFRALGLMPKQYWDENGTNITHWLELKPSELPREEVRQALSQCLGTLRETASAARREYCHWDMPLEEGYTMLIPGLGDLRNITRLLILRARLQLLDGQLDQALETLQTGFALARDVGKGPTLIQGLVGINIGRQMLQEVEQLIQQPNAPNLYWALTTLPRPFVDFEKSFEWESVALYVQYPYLRDLENTRLSVDQARRLMQNILGLLQGADTAKSDDVDLAWRSTGMTLLLYPEAKQALIRQGHSQDLIEALPTAQVVLTYQMQIYQRYNQNLFKWFHVPYPQARVNLLQTSQNAQTDFKTPRERAAGGMVLMFLPALHRVYFKATQMERNIDILRCVEAIRLYAARHHGILPPSIEAIEEVPAPEDPLAGDPFSYEAQSQRAELSGATIAGEKKREGIVYLIQMQP